MTVIYEPSRSLMSKVNRKLTVYRHQKKLPVTTNATLVSFTFDDCPVSGISNGVRYLEQQGWQSTVYVACGLFGTENHLGQIMNDDDARALEESGHEIGEHTFSHYDANSVPLETFLEDIERNQAHLSELGIKASQTFAYPYGETHAGLKAVLSDRFLGARGIQSKYHTSKVDLNQIGSVPLFEDTVDLAIESLREISKRGGWLTFFTHDVCETPSPWGCSPKTLKTVATLVKELGAQVKPVCDVIAELEKAA